MRASAAATASARPAPRTARTASALAWSGVAMSLLVAMRPSARRCASSHSEALIEERWHRRSTTLLWDEKMLTIALEAPFSCSINAYASLRCTARQRIMLHEHRPTDAIARQRRNAQHSKRRVE